MRFIKEFTFAVCISLFAEANFAQTLNVEVAKNLNYKQTVTPVHLDNYLFYTYYAADRTSYNLKGFRMGATKGKIKSLKANPAGFSYAVLSENKNGFTDVAVFDVYAVNNVLHKFTDITDATAIEYSFDSRHLFIATSTGVFMYNTKTYKAERSLKMYDSPKIMVASPNGYYLALVSENKLSVIDIDNWNVRTQITFEGNINAVSFSDDSSTLGVLTDNGNLGFYDTADFSNRDNIGQLGNAKDFSFHPEGKYVAVATDGNKILFINTIDPLERHSIIEPAAGVGYVRFIENKDDIYLTYNSERSVRYKLLKGFTPNYTKHLRDELSLRMSEWSKMLEDESFDEYKLRVNEETRAEHAKLLEYEIATRMADNLVFDADVTLGGYNPESTMLTLNFDNMPSIYLNVPKEDIPDFMDSKNLEFRDAVYGISKNDKFELIYANVYNKQTGKSYEFNNLERASLDYIYTNDDFVDIELVQQSSLEEIKLNDIKHSVVGLAKQENLISDHTDIKVNTEVIADVDASGNKVANYKVGFNYTVNASFSAYEDFPAGKYKIEHSNAAASMLKIVRQAFETDFAQYITPDKKVIIKVKGTADAIPINGAIAYDGCYGEFENEPYYLNNDLTTINLSKKSGIKSNEQLAYIRSVAVKNYIQENLPKLSNMNVVYDHYVELSDKTGGAYRRISVEFIFVDAF